MQVVWWGWRSWRFGAGRFSGSLARVYRRWLRLGPLELRQWERL